MTRAATITYSDRDTQTSLMYVDENASGNSQAPMRSLDSLVESDGLPPPDLIKIDVQGFELEVLKGGERALAGAQAALLEVNWCAFAPGVPLVDEVVAYMSGRGFAWWDVMGLLRRPADDALWQMDVMFVRRDHALRGESAFDTLGRRQGAQGG
jgi:hypothetical protein